MLANLSLNNCVSLAIKKAEFIFQNANAKLFPFRNRHLRSVLHLPDVQQARWERKATYSNLVASHRGRSAVMFRVLQAELDSLKSIAIPGIVHGAAEVIERSTMVTTDHVCHFILKRKSAPWGSLRTPRRERLMADVAILSMLYESTAIVSVNSDLYLYQFIYLQNIPLLKLLQKFAVHTSVALVTEWFFTGASLAIETHQNIAVMAVWKKEKMEKK